MPDTRHNSVESPRMPQRRNVLKILWSGLGIIALGEILWAGASFLRSGSRPPVATPATTLVNAGTTDIYTPGSVTAFVRGRFYLACLEDGGFLAISRKCTHLGCTVPWDDEKKQFICPCHASSFDITGNVISPPAPRPLDIHPVTIENRVITVNTGKTVRRSVPDPSQIAYDTEKPDKPEKPKA